MAKMFHVKHIGIKRFDNIKMVNSKLKIQYDVVVIGAGHAGCEAALASSRCGSKTLLISINMDSIALMACNSAVGGPGRGQLVREIDVLGGEIAKNVDRNFIHMRMLNMSKGPAVRTLRAIVDKRRYFLSMKNVLENQDMLELKQGLVVDVKKRLEGWRVFTSDGNMYECRCVIISTGTFLRARIFWGKNVIEAGRQGEITSRRLPINLEKLGFKFGRLKTDTPPRVDRKTIDTSKLNVQHYDRHPEMFSYEDEYDGRAQLENYITYVEEECIDYISNNIKKSTVYGGSINSEGPKYCPSIEDKVLRFRDKKRHLVFIQPEGVDTSEMYLHGLSTTFSEEIQMEMLKRIRGLENAVITRPGYGVEYDYLLPNQIKSNLESIEKEGIFFAGQINGTTGYEEAAAQGTVAGINAARKSRKLSSIIINRQDGYIGILIDDIVVRGASEPYRMLTSRNEYRLFHRHNNADVRMVKILKSLGYEDKARKIVEKYQRIEGAIRELKQSLFYVNKGIVNKIKQQKLNTDEVKLIKDDFNLDDREFNCVLVSIKYEDYIKREIKRIEQVRNSMNLKIPEDIDYRSVKNISNEAVLSLMKKRPLTLDQASRTEGVGPSDIFSILCYIKNVSRET